MIYSFIDRPDSFSDSLMSSLIDSRIRLLEPPATDYLIDSRIDYLIIDSPTIDSLIMDSPAIDYLIPESPASDYLMADS